MVNYIKRFVIEPMYINHLNLINYDNKFPDGLQQAHRERDGGGGGTSLAHQLKRGPQSNEAPSNFLIQDGLTENIQ
jgi:hypothetical protein